MRARRNPIRGGRENPRPTAVVVESEARKIQIAREILDSQAFCEIMKGSCHQELHIHALRDLWREYQVLGGGYGCAEDGV